MPEADTSPPVTGAAEEIIELLLSGRTIGDGSPSRHAHPEESVLYHAYALFSVAKYEEAMRMFGYLLTLSPLDRRYYSGFASCMRKLRRYLEALKYYGFASALDLTDPEPVMYSAECFMALGDFEKARHSLDYGLGQARAHERHHHFIERLEAMVTLIDGAAPSRPTDPDKSVP